MSNLEQRTKRLWRRFRPPCPCRSWAIPVVGPLEPGESLDEERRLPERCPDCGRPVPVRCIVVRYVDREG